MSDEQIVTDDSYLYFLGVIGATDDPPSDDLKKSAEFYREAIDAMDEKAEDDEVSALIRQLGPNCKIDLMKKVKNFYEGRKFFMLTEQIPNLFSSHGFKSVDFADGRSVEIKTKIECRLNVGKDMSDSDKTALKERVAEWVSCHGFSNAVKTHLDFEKGAFDGRAKDLLLTAGYSFAVDESIHPQTLKKIVTDIYNDTGETPPSDIAFKVFSEAVFKNQKKAKF